MSRARFFVLPFLLAAVGALPAAAVDVEPRWQAGGPEGGVVNDIGFAPSDPQRVYATVGGHLYLSTNAGSSWRLTASGSVNLEAQALAVDPFDPFFVYASYQDEGVFSSSDGGRSWNVARAGLPWSRPSHPVYRTVDILTASHEHPGTLFAAVGGRGTLADQVYVSRDRGESWTLSLSSVATTFVAVSPRPGEMVYVGGHLGLRRSRDGGVTWEAVTGLESARVASIAFDPAERDTCWIGGAGVYRSTDGGATWFLHVEGLDDPNNPGMTLWVSSLAVVADDPGRLVAVAGGRPFLSTDGGQTWDTCTDPDLLRCTYLRRVVASPAGDGPTLGGGLEGVVRLEGEAWVPSRRGLYAAPIDLLLVNPERPSVAYAAEGVGCTSLPGLYRTTDGGQTWRDAVAHVGVWAVSSIAMDPADPSHLLVSTNLGEGLIVSTDGGDSWSVPDLPGDWPEELKPMAFAPSDPNRVYAFRWDDLLRSLDGGASWEPLPTELATGPDARAIAVDPANPDVVYVGLASGVSKTTDAGTTWADCNAGLPPGNPDGGCDGVVALAIPAGRPSSLLAVTFSSGLYVSNDEGTSWQRSNVPALAGGVALLGDRPDAILVGDREDGGIFVSEDGGGTWSRLGAAVDPVVGILTLAASPFGDLIYAGTTASVLHLRQPPVRRPNARARPVLP